MKLCSRCKIEKERADFSTGNRWCKACKKIQRKEYYEKHKEKEVARAAKWTQGHRERRNENRRKKRRQGKGLIDMARELDVATLNRVKGALAMVESGTSVAGARKEFGLGCNTYYKYKKAIDDGNAPESPTSVVVHDADQKIPRAYNTRPKRNTLSAIFVGDPSACARFLKECQ